MALVPRELGRDHTAPVAALQPSTETPVYATNLSWWPLIPLPPSVNNRYSSTGLFEVMS